VSRRLPESLFRVVILLLGLSGAAYLLLR
jgi:hypothetical protein